MSENERKAPFKVFNNHNIQSDQPSSLADDIANKVLVQLTMRANTETVNDLIKEQNEKIEKQNEKIDLFVSTTENLLNEFKKQTVDERNASLKISRNPDKSLLTVKSLEKHIEFIVFTGHIAELFKIYTAKKDNFSTPKTIMMLKDIHIWHNSNFSLPVPNGKKGNTTAKYHFTVFTEIKERLHNPKKHDIPEEKTFKWRKEATIPTLQEIENYIDNIVK